MKVSQIWETMLFDSFEKYGFVFTLYRACLAFGVVVFLGWLIGILLRTIRHATWPDAMGCLVKSLLRWMMCIVVFYVPLGIVGIALRLTL